MRTDAACWVIAILASFAIMQPKDKIVPVDKTDSGSWAKSCSDLKPIENAHDGSMMAVCIGKDDNKNYELIYRSITRHCNPVINAKDPRDDYKHFLCEEQFELMIRPQK